MGQRRLCCFDNRPRRRSVSPPSERSGRGLPETVLGTPPITAAIEGSSNRRCAQHCFRQPGSLTACATDGDTERLRGRLSKQQDVADPSNRSTSQPDRKCPRSVNARTGCFSSSVSTENLTPFSPD